MMNSAKDAARIYAEAGRKKAGTPAIRMLVLSILSGAFIALAAVGANTAVCMIENPSVSKLVGAMIFPAGLVMVAMTGAELFTGDNLMIISALEKKISWCSMIRCWIMVYVGNLIGSVLIAVMVNQAGQLSAFSGALAAATIKTAAVKNSYGFTDAVLLGILCNFLVCIAVWIGLMGKTVFDKIAGMYFPVLLFVAAGYEHSVANMYYIPAGLLASLNPEYAGLAADLGVDMGALSWGRFLLGNLVPVTIGNIIGGSLCVGAVVWYLYLKEDHKGVGKIMER